LNETAHATAFRTGKSFLPAVFILLVILSALWQISLFTHTLKWDAIDITLPWRYFVADALRYQQLPWWNPYQHHGFAQGLFPETWYPLGILLGIGRGYDLFSLNLEFIIHLGIASYGFYRLARTLGVTHQGSLWGALVFPLTGFFIGNAQHTGWIAAGAWIPHILASFMHWKQQPDLKNTLALTILSFFFVSGGYLAFTIILFYVLAVIWILHLIRQGRFLQRVAPLLWITGRLLFCVMTTLSVLLTALWQLKGDIDRGAGLAGEAVFKGSLYFKHLISLILPFSTVKGDYSFWLGDQSMMNLYLGIPALLLLMLSLKRLDQSFYRFWWIMALLSLGFALAMELPFRRWLNALPLFNLFRYPSLFRYFTILSLTLIAARMIGDHRYPNAEDSRFRKMVLKVSQIFLVLTSAGLAVMLIRDPGFVSRLSHLSITGISDAITFQLIIHSTLLTGFLVASRLLVNRMDFFRLLLLFTAADLIISTQINGRVSVFSEQPFGVMQDCMERLPQGYPLPSLYDAIGSNSDGSLQSGAIYRNTNSLYKRLGWDGYTPYQYQRYIAFEKTPMFEKALGLPALFVSTHLTRLPGNDYDDSQPVLNLPSHQFSITDFGLNQVTVRTNLPDRTAIVYNQNYTHGWRAEVDGVSRDIIPTDFSLMAVPVEAGSHLVKFYFQPGNLLNALIISGSCLCLCLIFYSWMNRHSKNYMLLLFGCLLTVAGSWLSDKKRDTTIPFRTLPVICNEIDQHHQNGESIRDRFLDQGDLERFRQITSNQREAFTYFTRHTCAPQGRIFTDYLRSEFNISDSSHHRDLEEYRGILWKQPVYFHMLNGFEAPLQGWKDQGVNLQFRQNNFYQSLKDRDYSATYTLDLQTIPWSATRNIRIRINHRNTEPVEASLIFNLQDESQQDLVWKSQRLTDYQPNDDTWTTHEWILPVETGWQPARFLNIYIWNKGKTRLEVDNIELILADVLPAD
jgi:hypothetical protein